MNRTSEVSRAFLSLMVALSIAAAGVPAVAQEEITLPALQGPALKSSQLGNGTHILVFFASWSPRCRTVVEQGESLAGRFGQRARVALVDFQEEPEAVREFLSDHSTRLPVYLDRDGELAKRYAVTSLPHLVVLRDGKTVVSSKFPEDAPAVVEKALR